MATLQEIVTAFDAFVESADGLGLGCIKGYPDFRNPNLNPPLAAIFYSGSNSQAAQARRRVGQSTKVISLTLGVYATHEVELFEVAQQLQALRAQPISLTAGSGGAAQQVQVIWGDDVRPAPDPDDVKELRHYIECPVFLIY
jgi:hypothetical protein